MIVTIIKFLGISLWAVLIIACGVTAGIKNAYKQLSEEKGEKE